MEEEIKEMIVELNLVQLEGLKVYVEAHIANRKRRAELVKLLKC